LSADPGFLICWFPGLLVSRHPGIPACRLVGMLFESDRESSVALANAAWGFD
jgi:hypothetical protein